MILTYFFTHKQTRCIVNVVYYGHIISPMLIFANFIAWLTTSNSFEAMMNLWIYICIKNSHILKELTFEAYIIKKFEFCWQFVSSKNLPDWIFQRKSHSVFDSFVAQKSSRKKKSRLVIKKVYFSRHTLWQVAVYILWPVASAYFSYQKAIS